MKKLITLILMIVLVGCSSKVSPKTLEEAIQDQKIIQIESNYKNQEVVIQEEELINQFKNQFIHTEFSGDKEVKIKTDSDEMVIHLPEVSVNEYFDKAILYRHIEGLVKTKETDIPDEF